MFSVKDGKPTLIALAVKLVTTQPLYNSEPALVAVRFIVNKNRLDITNSQSVFTR